MVKTINHIIKRILIGVGIALAVMFAKDNLFLSVSAKEMSTSSFGGLQIAVNGTDNNYIWDVTDGSWENWGSGVLIGNGSIIKTNGQSTSSFATVRSVMAYSGNQAYVCRMGSTSSNNSTYQNQTFTFECPMIMGQYGLQQIAFIYSHTGGTDFTMRLEVNGSMTFIKDEVDGSSGTTSAINNQITNDNTNTTNIINNQNDNTQQQIESQKVCKDVTIDSSLIFEDGYLRSNGTISVNSDYGISNYISLDVSSNLVVSTVSSNTSCFYDSSKTLISCFQPTSLGSVSIPTNARYLRVSFTRATNVPKFYLTVCQNGNQAIADGQQQLNDTLNNDTGVTDDFARDIISSLDVTSNTPISDLLTMPFTLLQAYISGMSGTCQSISLGQLYGSYLIIPCINLENYLGSSLWNLIDILFSIFLIYNICMLFVTVFDDITSLKDGFSWLYGVEGKHVGAPTSRVERNSDLY